MCFKGLKLIYVIQRLSLTFMRESLKIVFCFHMQLGDNFQVPETLFNYDISQMSKESLKDHHT